ncbi:hypothetical protein [Thermincola potens]|uniref:Uncharacterized protein n=1 Tax=Thermincola potens (strain JR) TaxID=635013 RepID=D5X8A5_THEPJ|nr:hypothetical protein [Thermincola potens]ADG82825.1 hypothetical protein TherJR_1978 [Thermincola potens JR]
MSKELINQILEEIGLEAIDNDDQIPETEKIKEQKGNTINPGKESKIQY